MSKVKEIVINFFSRYWNRHKQQTYQNALKEYYQIEHSEHRKPSPPLGLFRVNDRSGNVRFICRPLSTQEIKALHEEGWPHA